MAVVERLSEEEAALFAIMTDPSGIDQAEFLWHAPEQPENFERFRAWPFQWAWWRAEDELQIDQSARALDLNTPVPTPLGWTTIGDIVPGDSIYGADGEPVVVLSVSSVFEKHTCYEVCFDDHTSIVADSSHIWRTWTKRDRLARNPNRRGTPNPSLVTTKEIFDSLKTGGSRPENNHSIDVAPPIKGGVSDLPIDPYYLGYWLGDGTSATSEFHTDDEWVVEEIKRRGLDIVDRVAAFRYGVKFPYKHNRKTESVAAKLRTLGVLNNKHIPQEYLRASVSDRRDLLAGIVDSDGHLKANGSCEVIQKNEAIASGLIELLRSLGEKPRKTKKTAFLNGIDCGPVFRVTWRPRNNPACLPRKADNWYSPGRGFSLGQRRIVDVKPVSSRPTRCIEVSAEDGMFLAGEGMIPTHNSVGKTTGIVLRACALPFVYPGEEMLVTAPFDNHLSAVLDKIEDRILRTHFYDSMLRKSSSSNGVKRRPSFQINFLNGSRILGRIPGPKGTGCKGMHPLLLEQDECFPAGSLVLTKSGHVPIEQVKVGDKVWTHANRWRSVTKTFDRGFQNMVSIKGQGHPGLVCSENHKFWVASEMTAMIPSTDANGRDSVRKAKVITEPSMVPAKDLKREHYWSTPSRLDFSRHIPSMVKVGGRKEDKWEHDIDVYSPEWAWLCGLWVAEGSAGPTQCTWSIHEDEVEEVSRYMEKAGIPFNVYPAQNCAAANITVYSKVLCKYMNENFGKGGHSKRVPAWVLRSNRVGWRQGFFDGAVYGDGNTFQNGWNYTTVSKELALGISMLATSLDYEGVGIHYNDQTEMPSSTIRGREIKRGFYYQVRISRTSSQTFVHDKKRWRQIRSVEKLEEQQHCYDLEVEEDHSFVIETNVCSNSQDYINKGWTELNATLKTGTPGAVWRSHGVTTGARQAKFYEHSQPGSGWRVHRIKAFFRPTWTQDEKQKAIQQYGGSENDPDYRRNVHGDHGAEASHIFTLYRLMQCVDINRDSDYNMDEFTRINIKGQRVDEAGSVYPFLDKIPATHKKYKNCWAGMDVGRTIAPSEILVFGEEMVKGKPDPILKLLTRINMKEVTAPAQARVIIWLVNFYNLRAFSMDSTGIGSPIFDWLQEMAEEDPNIKDVLRTIKGYNFSEKILTGFNELVEVKEGMDLLKEAGIYRRVLEASTDALVDLVDDKRILLPDNDEKEGHILDQFKGQTYTVDGRSTDAYGRRTFSRGEFHALDAARMAILGYKQDQLETFVRDYQKEPVEEDVIDFFM